MMILDRLNKKPFAVVSHRTAAGVHPENSLSGIEYSIMVGADIVEFDVRMTRDGLLVLYHDENFRRVYGIDKKVRDVTYEWIIENITMGNDEKIPLLEDALEKTRGRIGVFVEIKEPDTTRQVVKTIEQYGDVGDTAIISFYDEAITTAKMIRADIITGLIYFKPPGRIFDAKKLKADLVLPHYRIATRKANQLAHRLKLKVVVWTINDEDKVIEAYQRGADGIASDYPEKLIKLRERLKSPH